MSTDDNETRLEVSSRGAEGEPLIVTEESEESKKHCWVCYLSEEDETESEPRQEWVRPCRCKGTAKWVHQNCLQRWIDEKQKSNSNAKVTCSQCKTEYLLIFPPNGRMVYVVELCDRLLYAASPFAAATLVIGSVYWTAVSYGAVTVMQVLGQEEGKAAMEFADPLMLLVGLPSIPVMLVLGKLVRWEDQMLKFWRKHYHRIPLLSYLVGEPPENPRDSAERILIGRDNFSDPISATRLFCGALILPSMATLVGRYLFNRIDSNFHRAILGGLTFIVAKGVVKIYLRQQQYIRQTKRKVLDYAEETCSCSEMKEKEKIDILNNDVLNNDVAPVVDINTNRH